ncbi:DUF5063 domain-containing protein [Microbacter margulisiae]|uniref:DUF5063 domain-containing protein n=1 Tax=Microbacter margulisiae TaxID=1350067 RepID=A0A7W5DPZ1_9PORP|nr:DUF5063 domain-containing protein [Microbacter margulisiae]MBB3186826.1 hypothetical protein [Microbacter margulisiae]
MPTATSSEKDRLEFITVAAEYCIFIENSVSTDKQIFIKQAVKYLPTLYLKTILLPSVVDFPEEESERTVTEAEYENVRVSIETLLGTDDMYLTTFHPEIQYSEAPIAASISEDLADILQELKDFLFNCQLGDEDLLSNALDNCLYGFHQHWGRKLLNALTALHQLQYNDDKEKEEQDEFLPPINATSQKESFLHHQLRDDSDDL